jgi:hypothetical protein
LLDLQQRLPLPLHSLRTYYVLRLACRGTLHLPWIFGHGGLLIAARWFNFYIFFFHYLLLFWLFHIFGSGRGQLDIAFPGSGDDFFRGSLFQFCFICFYRFGRADSRFLIDLCVIDWRLLNLCAFHQDNLLFELLNLQFHLIDGDVLTDDLVLEFLVEHDDFVALLDGVDVVALGSTAEGLDEFGQFVDVAEGDVVFLLLQDQHF